MSLNIFAILVSTVCYLIVCFGNLWHRDYPHALMWFAYALGNSALLWYEYTKLH